MGTPDAVSVVSLAFAGALRTSTLASTFPRMRVDIYQPRNFREPMSEGLSLYLYAVGLNASVRNAPDPKSRTGRRPPIALELHYLLTPWGSSPDVQQRLLGHALAFIEATAILSGNFLNSHAPGGITPFRPDEGVSLTYEHLSPEFLLSVSEIDGVRLPPSLAYVARSGLDPVVP